MKMKTARRQNIFAGCFILILVSLFAIPSISFGSAPLLYLGMQDSNNPTSRFSTYNADADTLTQLKSQFPQFSCLRFSLNGRLYGSQGSKIYIIDPATGEATLYATLNNGYYDFDCAGFIIVDLDYTFLIAHEYTNHFGNQSHRR